MKSFFKSFVFLITILSISITNSFTHVTYHSSSSSQINRIKALLPDNSTTLSGQWFLKYQAGKKNDENFSHFIITRGYITIKKKLTKNISGKITTDISIDKEGDGKGNTEFEPPWKLNAGFVAFEHKYFIFTGTYYKGLGNTFGTFVDASNNSTNQNGFSIFGDLKLLTGKVSLFCRYDNFKFSEKLKAESSEKTIIGIAHHFYKKRNYY